MYNNLFGGGGVRGGGKLGAKVRHDKACFYFDEGSWLLCWGVPHFHKNIGGGPIKWVSLGWGVHYGCNLSLIYRSMNKFPLFKAGKSQGCLPLALAKNGKE